MPLPGAILSIITLSETSICLFPLISVTLGRTRYRILSVVLEFYSNTTDKILYRVRPNVTEISGNKHIEVSDNVMIESIAPGKGIRYTALVRADNGLRDGEAVFRIGVFLGRNEIVSQTREFRIQTSKR